MSVQFWPRAHFDFGFTCVILMKPMDEHERKMLEEVVKLSQENNKSLRKLIGYHRSAVIFRVIYWTIIIGGAIAAYYSIQPYLTSLIGIYSGQDISKILNSFNGNLPK